MRFSSAVFYYLPLYTGYPLPLIIIGKSQIQDLSMHFTKELLMNLNYVTINSKLNKFNIRHLEGNKMRGFGKHVFLYISAIVLLLPITAQATNGYFLIGYGAKSRAMGGVGIALPQDSMAAASNPAGMAEVDSGMDIGAELFLPDRRVAAANGEFSFQTPNKEAKNPSEVESGSNEFLIPSMGAVYQFNRKLTIGMTVIGNGANTRYNSKDNFFTLTGLPPGESYGTLGVNLLQMQVLPTVAYKINKQNSIGASLTLAVQQFRAYGLGNFGDPNSTNDFQFSSDDANFTNKGNDYSYGAGVRVGWLGKYFNNKVNIGAYYASRTYMSKFDKYKGLFAEQGDFDIPAHFGVGLAIKPNDKITVAADIERIKYGDIAAIANNHPNSTLQSTCTRPINDTPEEQQACLDVGIKPQTSAQAMGEDDGFGFAWNDQTVYKIGASYKLNQTWTLRAGYNYAESPVKDKKILFSTIAPALVEKHLTLGFSYQINKNSAIDTSYIHGFENSQVCEAPGCKTMLTQEDGSFVGAKLKYDAIGAAYSYRF